MNDYINPTNSPLDKKFVTIDSTTNIDSCISSNKSKNFNLQGIFNNNIIFY